MTVESAAVVTVSPLETLGRTTGGTGGWTFVGDRNVDPFGLITLMLLKDGDPGRNGVPVGDRVGDLCIGEYAIGSCSRGDIAPVPPLLCALAWASACTGLKFSIAHPIRLPSFPYSIPPAPLETLALAYLEAVSDAIEGVVIEGIETCTPTSLVSIASV